jgi:LmbE family N-acetylglucosaminyl deacetylase
MGAVPDSLAPLLRSRLTTRTQALRSRLGSGPLVVVSPHLDDAVLSLGATIAHAVHTGVPVRVVTVLAGDPSSEHPADADNVGMGFATVGQAARVRRGEDEQACRLLGAEPSWLPFIDSSDFPRDPVAISAELAEQLTDAGAVLIPGHPLEHVDHDLVTRLALARAAVGTPLGLYVEQPYAAWRALRPPQRGGRSASRPVDDPAIAKPELNAPDGWRRSRSCLACARRKLVALGAYRSQLVVLRRWPRARIALYEMLAGGEYINWLHEAER